MLKKLRRAVKAARAAETEWSAAKNYAESWQAALATAGHDFIASAAANVSAANAALVTAAADAVEARIKVRKILEKLLADYE